MDWLSSAGEWLSGLFSSSGGVLSYFTFLIRIALPVLAVVILTRCIKSYCRGGNEGEVWGSLSLENGAQIPLCHWENLIGRAKSSDVFLDIPTVSRIHAALIRNSRGGWRIYDLASKSGVHVNGEPVFVSRDVAANDHISLGGVTMLFLPHTDEDEREQANIRTKPGREIRPGKTLLYLTEFQILLAFQLCISSEAEHLGLIAASFAFIIIMMWCYFLFIRSIRRRGVEVETIAFFLTTVGLGVTATSEPGALLKHVIFIAAGILLLLMLGWFLRNIDRVKKIRWPAAFAGLLLLAVNLVIAKVTYGAKNWLSIGGFSFQPSEFVKICFILTGAATLDRLFARRNLIAFIGFAGACVGALALMSDFGTAVIFFATYMVIAFLRSGSFATILLSVGGAGFGGFLVLMVKPYIASRFSSWGKAWQFVNDAGYQQTRTMTATASGGMFGVGAGNGWLKNVFAADTDMVFGLVAEELGMIVGLVCIGCLVALIIFSVKSAATGRSSFYVIAACSAASMLLFQMTLNTFGALDILPFTGVTFPFVSRGGSSLISCWGLLAFIKAADTRQNASFAIKLPKKPKRVKEKEQEYYDDAEHDNESYDKYDDDWYDFKLDDRYFNDDNDDHDYKKDIWGTPEDDK